MDIVLLRGVYVAQTCCQRIEDHRRYYQTDLNYFTRPAQDNINQPTLELNSSFQK